MMLFRGVYTRFAPFVLLPLASLLLCCKQSPTSPESCELDSYMPMAVGNEWIYDGYDVDTGGVMIDGSEFVQYWNVIDRETIHGALGWNVAMTGTGGFLGTKYFELTSCGIREIFRDSGCTCHDGLWLGLFPGKEPKGILSDVSKQEPAIPYVDPVTGVLKYAEHHIRQLCTSAGISGLDVGAGHFESLQESLITIESYSDSLTFSDGLSEHRLETTTWFAPGVGIVRMKVPIGAEVSSEASGFVLELRSHTLN